MESINRDIFKAIHDGKWLSIEYRNKENKITKYWIGIKSLDVKYKSLYVTGLHIGNFGIGEFRIYIDSIVSSALLDGTYQPINKALIDDIEINPQKYCPIFNNTANLKILNYLSDCNKLDTVPYKSEFCLIDHFDGDKLTPEGYILSEDQFRHIVNSFQKRFTGNSKRQKIQQLCLNKLSVNTKKGLYVLAYRRLELDVRNRILRPCPEITICKELTIDGEKQSIRQFLVADDYYLLEDFGKIKNL